MKIINDVRIKWEDIPNNVFIKTIKDLSKKIKSKKLWIIDTYYKSDTIWNIYFLMLKHSMNQIRDNNQSKYYDRPPCFTINDVKKWIDYLTQNMDILFPDADIKPNQWEFWFREENKKLYFFIFDRNSPNYNENISFFIHKKLFTCSLIYGEHFLDGLWFYVFEGGSLFNRQEETILRQFANNQYNDYLRNQPNLNIDNNNELPTITPEPQPGCSHWPDQSLQPAVEISNDDQEITNVILNDFENIENHSIIITEVGQQENKNLLFSWTVNKRGKKAKKK